MDVSSFLEDYEDNSNHYTGKKPTLSMRRFKLKEGHRRSRNGVDRKRDRETKYAEQMSWMDNTE